MISPCRWALQILKPALGWGLQGGAALEQAGNTEVLTAPLGTRWFQHLGQATALGGQHCSLGFRDTAPSRSVTQTTPRAVTFPRDQCVHQGQAVPWA